MRRRLVVASLLLACSLSRVGHVSANGRPPGTATIVFRQGNDAHVVAGTTFGMVVTHDSGATWHWMCEKAVGYGGTYDPDYSYSSSGAIFATTFEGLAVNRDGCVFEATPLLTKFSSAVEGGPTAAIHVAITDPNDAKLYRSDDDGATFPVSANPGMINDWWQSVVIAPSDENRVYVAGYRFVPNPDGDAGTIRQYTLFKSVDKGATFLPMELTGLATSPDSVIEIAGVSPTTPDLVFARVTYVNAGVIGDAIYRSTNAGTSWTKVIQAQDSLNAFVVRKNGQVLASTPSKGAATLGTFLSDDCRINEPCTTWTLLPTTPHLSCLVENAAEELWGCTQNFGGNQLPADGYGIMKTTDLATWTGVLKYQELDAPVVCPAGTAQKDMCEAEWCALAAQLGITSTAIYCPPVFNDGPPDAAGSGSDDGKKGCCDTGGQSVPGGVVMLAMVIAIVIARPRRSRRSR